MMVAGALWKPAARAFLFLGTEKWSPRGSFLLFGAFTFAFRKSYKPFNIE
jgi:hypothetical protein